MGGIVSSFQFLSYKIDKIAFEVQNKTDVLLANTFNKEWSIKLSLSRPIYIPAERMYIGGVGILLFYGKEENPEIKLESRISGIFKVVGKDFSKEHEEKLVKYQIPAILSPYLRATVTNILASAGCGSVVLPLFNFNAFAEEQLKDVDILVLDENSSQ